MKDRFIGYAEERAIGFVQKRVTQAIRHNLPREPREMVDIFSDRIKKALEYEGKRNKKISVSVMEATFNGINFGETLESGEYFFERLILDDGYPYWDRIETRQGELLRIKLRTDGTLLDVLQVSGGDIRSAEKKLRDIRNGIYR